MCKIDAPGTIVDPATTCRLQRGCGRYRLILHHTIWLSVPLSGSLAALCSLYARKRFRSHVLQCPLLRRWHHPFLLPPPQHWQRAGAQAAHHGCWLALPLRCDGFCCQPCRRRCGPQKRGQEEREGVRERLVVFKMCRRQAQWRGRRRPVCQSASRPPPAPEIQTCPCRFLHGYN